MTREKLLSDLLGMKSNIHDVAKQLEEFSWDSSSELIFLNKEHILNVLRRYVTRELTSTDVEEWANFIEGRDDIGYAKDDSTEHLKKIIHKLANPELTEQLTKTVALEICRELESSGKSVKQQIKIQKM